MPATHLGTTYSDRFLESFCAAIFARFPYLFPNLLSIHADPVLLIVLEEAVPSPRCLASSTASLLQQRQLAVLLDHWLASRRFAMIYQEGRGCVAQCCDECRRSLGCASDPSTGINSGSGPSRFPSTYASFFHACDWRIFFPITSTSSTHGSDSQITIIDLVVGIASIRRIRMKRSSELSHCISRPF